MSKASQTVQVPLPCNQRGEFRPHPRLDPQPAAANPYPHHNLSTGQRGVQLIHRKPCSEKKRSRSRLFTVEKLGENQMKQSSSEEGVNIILLINKYLLFIRHKAKKVSMERGKLTRKGSRSSQVTRRFHGTQDLKLKPTKHTTAAGFFLLTLTGPVEAAGREATRPRQAACHLAPVIHCTACACWWCHLNGVGHSRTAGLAALPP